MNTASATRLRDQLDEMLKDIDESGYITDAKEIDTAMTRIYDAMRKLTKDIDSRL